MNRCMTFAPSGSQVVRLGDRWGRCRPSRPPDTTAARRSRCVGAAHGVRAHSDSTPSMLRVLVLHHRADLQHVERLPPSDGAFGTPAFGQAVGAMRRVRTGERRQRDVGPVDVELVDREGVRELPRREEIVGRARRRRAGLQPGVGREQREIGRPAPSNETTLTVGAPAYICALLNAHDPRTSGRIRRRRSRTCSPTCRCRRARRRTSDSRSRPAVMLIE